MERGDILLSLYLLSLSLLPLSSAVINLLYPFPPTQSLYFPYQLFLQQLIFAEKVLPLSSCILGVASLLAFVWFEQGGRILPSLYLVLFVVSRFAAFLFSYQPQQALLLFVALLFPDTTIYHSASYLACTLVALPALIYVNRD